MDAFSYMETSLLILIFIGFIWVVFKICRTKRLKKRKKWGLCIVAFVGVLVMAFIGELLIYAVQIQYKKKESERQAEIVRAHVENLDFGMILPEYNIEQQTFFEDYIEGNWYINFSEPLSRSKLDSLCHAKSTGWSYELVTWGHGMGSHEMYCYVFTYSYPQLEEGVNRITIYPNGEFASLEFRDF